MIYPRRNRIRVMTMPIKTVTKKETELENQLEELLGLKGGVNVSEKEKEKRRITQKEG
jgi:hypothetical protein